MSIPVELESRLGFNQEQNRLIYIMNLTYCPPVTSFSQDIEAGAGAGEVYGPALSYDISVSLVVFVLFF